MASPAALLPDHPDAEDPPLPNVPVESSHHLRYTARANSKGSTGRGDHTEESATEGGITAQQSRLQPEKSVSTVHSTTDSRTLKLLEELMSGKTVNVWEWTLDISMSVIIILYTSILFLQAQWRGWQVGVGLGVSEQTSRSWEHADPVFTVFDHVFNVIFIIELVLRLLLLRWKFFRDPFNLYDLIVVAATSADAYLLHPLGDSEGQNLFVTRLVRIFRMARLVRVFRIVRLARRLVQLRVMVDVLSKCLPALAWSLLILAMIILGSGVFVSQLVNEFLADEAADIDARLWVFEYYGDAARASYTMFEATFSGSWPALSRPLLDHVSIWFGLWWVMYQIVISFAVLRIIGAIFLNETIKAAHCDSEFQVMSKLKEKDKFAGKLRSFFEAADTSGDGRLSLQELQTALDNPEVFTWLKILELEIYEVVALFRLLDDNKDGTVSYEEFLGGAVRLKGNARAIDSILIMHGQHQLVEDVTRVSEHVEYIFTALEPLLKECSWHMMSHENAHDFSSRLKLQDARASKRRQTYDGS